MRRLIGAESGETTASIRSAETILPKPMLISFIASLFHLFDILHLLADLLDLRLELNNHARDLDVVAL